jgi:hypothetical protein
MQMSLLAIDRLGSDWVVMVIDITAIAVVGYALWRRRRR